MKVIVNIGGCFSIGNLYRGIYKSYFGDVQEANIRCALDSFLHSLIFSIQHYIHLVNEKATIEVMSSGSSILLNLEISEVNNSEFAKVQRWAAFSKLINDSAFHDLFYLKEIIFEGSSKLLRSEYEEKSPVKTCARLLGDEQLEERMKSSNETDYFNPLSLDLHSKSVHSLSYKRDRWNNIEKINVVFAVNHNLVKPGEAQVLYHGSSSSSSSAIPTSNANLSQAGSSFFRSNQIYRVVAESVDNQIIFCLVVVPSSRDSVLGGPATNTKYVESESQNLALLITSYLGGELTIIYNRNCNKNITLFQIIVNHSKMTRFDKTAFETIINSELRKRNVNYFIHLKEITFKGYELDRLNTHDASPLCPVGQKVLEIAYKRDYFGNLDAATYIFAPRIVVASDSPVMASGDAHYRLTKHLASVLEKIDIDTISFSSAIEVREYTKALRRACTSTHPMILDLVKALLEFKEELKIDINEPAGYLHYTALHHAARKGNKELYDYLVEKGADPQLKDAKGNSAEDILKQTELSKAASVLKL